MDMELKIMDVSSLHKPLINVYGAVEWAHSYPPSAMWFAWYLGKCGIEGVYYNRKKAPREVHLTVQPGEDTILEMIQQIKAMLEKRGKK